MRIIIQPVKNRKIKILTGCFLMIAMASFAQSASKEALIKGVNFIQTKSYTLEENSEILKLYENLRVADVSDGLDMVGLPNTGLVDPSIHAAWKDYESLTHVIRGIALTVRYVPTQKSDRPSYGQDFFEWHGFYCTNYSAETFIHCIQPGSVIVIDDVEEKDIGTIGSNNVLTWKEQGAVGVITDASARDTDEIAIEGFPLYLRKKGRGIRTGRNELESVNRPLSIGGVLVCPGDVVVADGDGVIIVPRAVAKDVALHAAYILEIDKKGRKQLYEKLGLPLDDTVK